MYADDEARKYIESVAVENADNWFYSHVAGVSHRNDDGTSRQAAIRKCEILDELTLVPEPTNRYDPNAIRAHSPTGEQIGYLDAYTAGQVAHWLESGYHCKAIVASIGAAEGTRRLGMRIAVLRMPAPGTEKYLDFQFMKMLRQNGDKVGADGYRIVVVSGSDARNRDGSSRQDMLCRVTNDHKVELRVSDTGTVLVFDEAGRQLGYLSTSLSREIVAAAAEGSRWAVFVRGVQNDERGKLRLRVGLFRIGPEWVQKAGAQDGRCVIDLRGPEPKLGSAAQPRSRGDSAEHGSLSSAQGSSHSPYTSHEETSNAAAVPVDSSATQPPEPDRIRESMLRRFWRRLIR